MKTKKMSLDKFRIAKLRNANRIKGGETTEGGTTLTKNTEESPPKQVCINYSRDFVNE